MFFSLILIVSIADFKEKLLSLECKYSSFISLTEFFVSDNCEKFFDKFSSKFFKYSLFSSGKLLLYKFSFSIFSDIY